MKLLQQLQHTIFHAIYKTCIAYTECEISEWMYSIHISPISHRTIYSYKFDNIETLGSIITYGEKMNRREFM